MEKIWRQKRQKRNRKAKAQSFFKIYASSKQVFKNKQINKEKKSRKIILVFLFFSPHPSPWLSFCLPPVPFINFLLSPPLPLYSSFFFLISFPFSFSILFFSFSPPPPPFNFPLSPSPFLTSASASLSLSPPPSSSLPLSSSVRVFLPSHYSSISHLPRVYWVSC